MSRKTYTVTGSSSVEPTNLPDGFSVQTTEEYLKGRVGSVYVSEQQNGYTYVSVGGTGTTLDRAELGNLRDLFNRVLNQPGLMRAVQDMNDPVTDTWRWFEMAPDHFVYAVNRESATRRYGQQANVAISLDRIKDEYGGIRNIEWEEV
jgi:hypothetical protein